MTEDRAREICAQLGATLTMRRKQRGGVYLYASRWLPARVALEAGYKVGLSNGAQFDRYLCSLDALADLDESTLRMRIASLPQNPNKGAPPSWQDAATAADAEADG